MIKLTVGPFAKEPTNLKCEIAGPKVRKTKNKLCTEN